VSQHGGRITVLTEDLVATSGCRPQKIDSDIVKWLITPQFSPAGIRDANHRGSMSSPLGNSKGLRSLLSPYKKEGALGRRSKTVVFEHRVTIVSVV
jgi:hypothetical protein